jgi:serine/threonine protein phosphatase PrpC
MAPVSESEDDKGQTSETAADSILLAMVLDGHGMLGEVAARVAARAISKELEGKLFDCVIGKGLSLREYGRRNVEQLIHEAFEKAHQDVLEVYESAPAEYRYPEGSDGQVFELQEHHAVTRKSIFKNKGRRPAPKPYVYRSIKSSTPSLVEFGTTASVVLVDGDFAVISHVGDSSIVQASVEDKFLDGTLITKPHTGHSVSEMFRIGEIICEDEELAEEATVREDGYVEVTNLAGVLSCVALSMTRAIGHLHLQSYGVIPRPDIKFKDIFPEDVCFIIASDGVWDVCTPRQASMIVWEALSNGATLNEAARILCDKAVELCKSTYGAADNTSAVIVLLGGPYQPVPSIAEQATNESTSDTLHHYII